MEVRFILNNFDYKTPQRKEPFSYILINGDMFRDIRPNSANYLLYRTTIFMDLIFLQKPLFVVGRAMFLHDRLLYTTDVKIIDMRIIYSLAKSIEVSSSRCKPTYQLSKDYVLKYQFQYLKAMDWHVYDATPADMMMYIIEQLKVPDYYSHMLKFMAYMYYIMVLPFNPTPFENYETWSLNIVKAFQYMAFTYISLPDKKPIPEEAKNIFHDYKTKIIFLHRRSNCYHKIKDYSPNIENVMSAIFSCLFTDRILCIDKKRDKCYRFIACEIS